MCTSPNDELEINYQNDEINQPSEAYLGNGNYELQQLINHFNSITSDDRYGNDLAEEEKEEEY